MHVKIKIQFLYCTGNEHFENIWMGILPGLKSGFHFLSGAFVIIRIADSSLKKECQISLHPVYCSHSFHLTLLSPLGFVCDYLSSCPLVPMLALVSLRHADWSICVTWLSLVYYGGEGSSSGNWWRSRLSFIVNKKETSKRNKHKE